MRGFDNIFLYYWQVIGIKENTAPGGKATVEVDVSVLEKPDTGPERLLVSGTLALLKATLTSPRVTSQ